MKRMTWAISLFRSACVAVLVAAAVAPLAASGDEVAPAGLLQLSLEQRADQFFGAYFVAPLATVFFWEVPVIRMPIVVLWLLVGSIYFTLRMGFVNVRMFGHAIELVSGKYDDPEAVGEVSHFQALATALSATVGLGNIAGVAIAVSVGGPGATLWMIVAGFLGMSAKFTEVTLGQMYRHIRPDGSVMGGAMYYLSDGLAARGLAPLGRVLAVAFAILCIGGSLGGGNSFQVKQGLDQIRTVIPVFDAHPWAYGLVMVVLVGIVIIGGIRRIASVADKIVPAMCILYVLSCLYVVLANAAEVPAALVAIVRGAFSPDAAFGGFLPDLRRAAAGGSTHLGGDGRRDLLVSLRAGDRDFSVLVLDHDLLELLRRAVLDLALRRASHDSLPAALSVVHVPGLDCHGYKCSRLLRPHDPGHGLPQHPGRLAALGHRGWQPG